MIGYHFTSDKLRDGQTIPAVGVWLEHTGLVIPCESGLHWSEEPFDALQYASGALLHKVEGDGDIIAHGDPIDKYVGRRRRIIHSIDATELLYRFACDQALTVIHLWNPPAPEVVLEYLKTCNPKLRAAARDAAWDAAGAAARAAAGAAARAAAGAAAGAAAWAAAGDAAGAAAWAAAGDAARAAAWAAARKSFNELIYKAFA